MNTPKFNIQDLMLFCEGRQGNTPAEYALYAMGDTAAELIKSAKIVTNRDTLNAIPLADSRPDINKAGTEAIRKLAEAVK